MVVGAGHAGESCDFPGSHGVAGEDVGREAAAVALSRCVDPVGVDAELLSHGDDHVQSEGHVVACRLGVALPLLVDAFGVKDEHVLVLVRIGEFGERFLAGRRAGSAVESEDEAGRFVVVEVWREMQEAGPLDVSLSEKAELVALSGAAAYFPSRVDGFSTAFARTSVSLAEDKTKAKQAEAPISYKTWHIFDSTSFRTVMVGVKTRQVLAKSECR